MPQVDELMSQYAELVQLLHGRPLSFPIETKADFAEQLAASGDQIEFGGVVYDTRRGAGSLPEFFFPLESADDLAIKAIELVVSRGLLPLPVSQVAPSNAGGGGQ